jgi:hypothetical protein
MLGSLVLSACSGGGGGSGGAINFHNPNTDPGGLRYVQGAEIVSSAQKNKSLLNSYAVQSTAGLFTSNLSQKTRTGYTYQQSLDTAVFEQ